MIGVAMLRHKDVICCKKKFDEAMETAVASDEKFMKLWNLLDDFFDKKNHRHEADCGSGQLSDPSPNDIGDKVGILTHTGNESRRLLSPLSVRKHGRAPKNRKISKVEKRASKRKNKVAKVDKKGKQMEA